MQCNVTSGYCGAQEEAEPTLEEFKIANDGPASENVIVGGALR